MVAPAEFRPAMPSDAGDCAAILNAWIDATPWMPRCHPHDDIARHTRDVVLRERDVTIAARDGTTCGYLAIDRSEAMITALYLAASCRRQGIGRVLLAHAKSKLPKGLSLWTFEANHGAQRFYQREGLREASRSAGDNEEGLPDILFTWTPETAS